MSYQAEEHYKCPCCNKDLVILIDVSEGIYQEIQAECTHCHRPIGIEVELEDEEIFEFYAFSLEKE